MHYRVKIRDKEKKERQGAFGVSNRYRINPCFAPPKAREKHDLEHQLAKEREKQPFLQEKTA